MADSKKDTPQSADDAAQAAANPHGNLDPSLPDGPDLDPTKVVGDYAEQPDPNSDKSAPLPNIPPGVKKAPADDEPGAPAIGDGTNS